MKFQLVAFALLLPSLAFAGEVELFAESMNALSAFDGCGKKYRPAPRSKCEMELGIIVDHAKNAITRFEGAADAELRTRRSKIFAEYHTLSDRLAGLTDPNVRRAALHQLDADLKRYFETGVETDAALFAERMGEIHRTLRRAWKYVSEGKLYDKWEDIEASLQSAAGSWTKDVLKIFQPSLYPSRSVTVKMSEIFDVNCTVTKGYGEGGRLIYNDSDTINVVEFYDLLQKLAPQGRLKVQCIDTDGESHMFRPGKKYDPKTNTLVIYANYGSADVGNGFSTYGYKRSISLYDALKWLSDKLPAR